MRLSKHKLEAIVAALKHACAQHEGETRKAYVAALQWAEEQQRKRAGGQRSYVGAK